MVTDVLLAFDHLRHEVTVLANVVAERRRRACLRGRRRGDRRRARAAARAGAAGRARAAREPPEFASNMGSDGYAEAVERAKEYIRAGDVYQVVPSQRWSADCPVDAFSIYRGLRAINPSPYMYFLDFEDFEIAGASPESLVTVTGRRVRPAPDRRHAPARRLGRAGPRAGARAAGRREGARRARDARGPRPQRPRAGVRVRLACTVDELMAVETYSHVMHIVSSVSGTLARGRDADGRAARVAARGHAVGRAQDPRDADHRRARAGRPRPLRRRGGLPLLHGRPRHLHLHPLGAREGRARAHPGRRRHRRRLGRRPTRCARPRPRRAR